MLLSICLIFGYFVPFHCVGCFSPIFIWFAWFRVLSANIIHFQFMVKPYRTQIIKINKHCPSFPEIFVWYLSAPIKEFSMTNIAVLWVRPQNLKYNLCIRAIWIQLFIKFKLSLSFLLTTCIRCVRWDTVLVGIYFNELQW